MPNPPSSEDSDPYYSGDSVYYGELYSCSNSSTTTVPLYRKSSFVKTNYWTLTESEMRKVLHDNANYKVLHNNAVDNYKKRLAGLKKQTREISTEENTV